MQTAIVFITKLGLSEFEAIALVRIVIAAICGGLIGLEREIKGRPAGLKTFSLVCMGATLAMITNEYIYIYMAKSTGDTARMAAQVISGIGFLGAGTIMVTGHNQVKGLTTAAALWVTASIGIAIGTGFYFGGLVGLAIIYIVSYIYRYVDKKIMEGSKVMRIYVEGKDEAFMLRLIDYFKENEIKILSLSRNEENKWFIADSAAMIEMDLGKKQKHIEILKQIRSLKDIIYIEKI